MSAVLLKAHAEEDAKKKEEIELHNQADNLVFTTKKQLTELGDKLNAEAKGKLETASKELEDAIKSNNSEEIKTKMDALNKIWSEASTQMYEAAKQAPPTEPNAETSEKKDDKKVENADFEVMDDK